MGICFGRVEVVHVGDDPKDPNYGIGFAKTLFKEKEWNTCKQFCVKKGIHQTDLNKVFDKYLSHDEVYLRQFRVRTLDTRGKFEEYGLLSFEISDIFIPLMFHRPYPGLEKPKEIDEATFPRFIIIAYTFCQQPICDLVFDYFMLLRKSFKIKTTATVFSYHLVETMHVLCEELQEGYNSGVFAFLAQKLNPRNDLEYTLETICRFAVKYPVMFYPLQRFRNLYKRIVFGEYFWTDKKVTKSRFHEFRVDGMKGWTPGYENDSAAVRQSARAVIADVAAQLHLEKLEEMALGLPADSEGKVPESHTPDKNNNNNNDNNDNLDNVEITHNELSKEGDDDQSVGNMSLGYHSIGSDSQASLVTKLRRKNDPQKQMKEIRTRLKAAVVPSIYVTDEFFEPIDSVSEEICMRMKIDLGYKLARKIILESELPWHESQSFPILPPENDTESRFHDTAAKQDFVYNVGRGTSSWVTTFTDDDGDIARETWTKISRPITPPVKEVMKEVKEEVKTNTSKLKMPWD